MNARRCRPAVSTLLAHLISFLPCHYRYHSIVICQRYLSTTTSSCCTTSCSTTRRQHFSMRIDDCMPTPHAYDICNARIATPATPAVPAPARNKPQRQQQLATHAARPQLNFAMTHSNMLTECSQYITQTTRCFSSNYLNSCVPVLSA